MHMYESHNYEYAYYCVVAQLNVDDLATTDVDKLNLCALEFKISAGYFGRSICVQLCVLFLIYCIHIHNLHTILRTLNFTLV